MKKCSICKINFNDDVNFCTNCGAGLRRVTISWRKFFGGFLIFVAGYLLPLMIHNAICDPSMQLGTYSCKGPFYHRIIFFGCFSGIFIDIFLTWCDVRKGKSDAYSWIKGPLCIIPFFIVLSFVFLGIVFGIAAFANG